MLPKSHFESPEQYYAPDFPEDLIVFAAPKK